MLKRIEVRMKIDEQTPNQEIGKFPIEAGNGSWRAEIQMRGRYEYETIMMNISSYGHAQCCEEEEEL